MITRELYLTVRKNGVDQVPTTTALHVLVEEDGTLAEYGKEYVTGENRSVALCEGSTPKLGSEPDVWLVVEGVGEDARRTEMLPQWLGLMWRPI